MIGYNNVLLVSELDLTLIDLNLIDDSSFTTTVIITIRCRSSSLVLPVRRRLLQDVHLELLLASEQLIPLLLDIFELFGTLLLNLP